MPSVLPIAALGLFSLALGCSESHGSFAKSEEGASELGSAGADAGRGGGVSGRELTGAVLGAGGAALGAAAVGTGWPHLVQRTRLP